MLNDLATVVLFVYNRPKHTHNFLESLLNNTEAENSNLIIYADHPRKESDVHLVNEVIEVCEKVSTRFKSCQIIRREENYGCAKNIIAGLTEQFKVHRKLIVCEDDLCLHPDFLKYMNYCLNAYQNCHRIWHVSGYADHSIENSVSTHYSSSVMNCWGWGTWSDKWELFTNNQAAVNQFFTKAKIREFNLNGAADFFRGIIDNFTGVHETWAVFWHASIFMRGGVCITPCVPFVFNAGNDGSGNHVGLYKVNQIYEHRINDFKIADESEQIEILGKEFEHYRNKKKWYVRLIIKITYICPSRIRNNIFKLYRMIVKYV